MTHEIQMVDDRYRVLIAQARIDLKKMQDVELWTDVLGIYAADLVDAVSVVGNSSSAVLQYIVDNNLVGKRLRTSEPKHNRGGVKDD